ncbi:MAG: heavy-metal-associated domain-containing protein [Candidatus Obscuribacterales bacterium]|nr:heavy-metal-associated domain-containing protein [Candidatus Obscuribacterales bacterium]
MAAKLSPVSSGVVHSSARRTRLKVAHPHRTAHNAVVVKDAIEKVPGVESVHIAHGTGNVVITHDDRPDILEHIGDAIYKVAPDVLEALVIGTHTNGMGLGLSGLWAVGTVLGKIFGDAATTESSNESPDGKPDVNKSDVKKYIPYAFLAAGVIQVLETEALMMGMAPLALFYYAFDTHWKFKQSNELDRIEAELEKVKVKQDVVSNDVKQIANS